MRIPVALMIALLTDLIKLDKFLCENIQNDNNQRLIRLGLIDAMKDSGREDAAIKLAKQSSERFPESIILVSQIVSMGMKNTNKIYGFDFPCENE